MTTDLQRRTEQARDPNQVKEVERQPGAVNAVAFIRDGDRFAVASLGEARISTNEGNRKATLSGPGGAVFAVAFSPDGKRLDTGVYDGQVRIFDAEKGQLVKAFVPVPVGKEPCNKNHHGEHGEPRMTRRKREIAWWIALFSSPCSPC